MLSIKRVRELVGPDCSLTDEQLEDERNGLYALARAILPAYRRARSSPHASDHRLQPKGNQEALEEPAGVLKFEAGVTRETAESGVVGEDVSPLEEQR
jgi:hypothetical protein